MKIGIVGCGAIGFAYAGFLSRENHDVDIFSISGGAEGLINQHLICSGLFSAQVHINVANDINSFAEDKELFIIATSLDRHKLAIDKLLPVLTNGHIVLVSSMNSLSSQYLADCAHKKNLQINVAAIGTTFLTARRTGENKVDILTKRQELGIAVNPQLQSQKVISVLEKLFGKVLIDYKNPIAITLSNTNPIAHGPLAIFNWTRIEKRESWSQYFYMSADISRIIKQLDDERLAIAKAFGINIRNIEEHFHKSFSASKATMAEIAQEMYINRGGKPLGPIDINTRFLDEDIPYGLVFNEALGMITHTPTPTTSTIINTAQLLRNKNYRLQNQFINLLEINSQTAKSLLEKVSY